MSIISDIGLDSYVPDQSAPRYTQDFINIEDIREGMIITKDKRYMKMVEVKPINFFMRSLPEQDDIVNDFANWLIIAPINIQIKVVTSIGNPEEIIKRVKERYEKDQDVDVQYLIKHYTNLLEEIGGWGAITRKFYMIIAYEQRPGAQRLKDPVLISNEIDRNIATIKEYFSRMGNIVTQFGEHEGELDRNQETWLLGKFLYEYFNIRTNRNEGIRKRTTFSDRISRIYDDTRKANENAEVEPPIASLIAPTGVDVTNPDCVIMDGMYYTSIIISGSGYPPSVQGGWINFIVSMTYPGETVDMFFHKENTQKVLMDVSNKVKFTSIKLADRNEFQTDYEKIENALNSARYIKECINNENQKPFTITTVITLCASKYKVLMERKQEVIDNLTSVGIEISECKYLQEEAFKSSFPTMSLSKKILKRGKRNIMNKGLAACYPFTSYEMQDQDGFLLGLNLYNDTMCIMNPFDTKSYKNANMVLLGTSGAGKTYTEQLMALRLRELGTQVFILAPDKASEYKRACDGVNGSFIKISPASRDHINIMDIRPVESKSAEFLQGDAAENTIYVASKAQTIITFIELLIPDLRNEEQQRLDTSIVATYAKYGINEDNNSIWVDPYDKSQGLKEMPILEDVLAEVEARNYDHLMDRVIGIMSQFTTGSAKSFNCRTNVNLKNKYIVFDLSDLQGKYIPAGMFVALDFIMGRIKEDVLERKMVFIDEGWQLIGGGSNEKAAEYVNQIFKTIRGYNGGACIATQDIKDFFSLQNGKYGNAILSNSKIKILLQLEANEAEFVKEELKLTRAEIRDIRNFKRGYCLICANSNHVPVNVIGSDYATKLITTDPQLVRKVVEEMEANGGILK